MLHIRHRGESHEIPFDDLGVTSGHSDEEIKTAVANRFDVADGEFKDYVLEREENGTMTLRPEAVFGGGFDK